MLKERARIIASGILSLDLALVSVAFVVSHAVRDRLLPELGWSATGLHDLRLYLPLLAVALPIFAVCFWLFGLYQSHRTQSLVAEIFSIGKSAAVAGGLLTLAIFLFRLDDRFLGVDRFSRLWLGLFGAGAFVLLVAEKLGIRLLARRLRARGYNYRTLLIVGAGKAAAGVLEALSEHRFWGYRVLGLLGEEGAGQPTEVAGHPVLGTIAELPRVVEERPVDEVIFALGSFDSRRLQPLFESLAELGINARVVLSSPFAEEPGARLTLGELGGLPLLTYATAPVTELGLLSKRLIDLLVASVLLAAALPLMAVIALAIKLDSPGPVLFRQVRIGLNGRRFTMLKFRTMVEGAASAREALEHLNEAGGPMFKARRDPRVTGTGRKLRRFSLDELPQLWNVLRGDMSLVGPRPVLPAEVSGFARWQRRRMSMRPGLTCLWQIAGRSQIGFEDWVRLDLAYIDNWSPLLDLKILFKTIPAVLSGRGAW